MKSSALFFLVVSLISQPVFAAAEKTNVLLIITDEHNFRTLGCYRDWMPREQAEMWGLGATVATPNIDRLAKQGVLCTRAYATSPVCSPCRAAMMTGRYPHATGVPTNNEVLDRSIPTLADRLNEAGYRTAFIGKWHLGGNGKPEWAPKVDGGFQFKKFMFNRGHWKKFEIKNQSPRIAARKNGKPTYGVDGADSRSFSTDWLTDRAINYIDQDDSKPFLTVISYPDPHGPNTVRTPYDTQFESLPFKAPRTYKTGLPAPKWLGGGQNNHPIFRGSSMAQYFGMVKCLDDNIGRLTKHLEKTGKLADTLIIMTSDHGDLCYEHDRLNKGNPYEGSARVPLIWRHPDSIESEQVYTQPIGTVDLTPTIISFLGLKPNPNDQGRDLSRALAAGSQRTNKRESEVRKNDSPAVTFLRNAGKSAGWVAAVDARYKLILSVNDTPWLFDAKDDPDELKNAFDAPRNAKVSLRLATALKAYGKRTNDPHLKHPRIASSLAGILAK